MFMETWTLHSVLSLAKLAQIALPLAYIDPSSGGMLFQLLAVLFTLFSGFILFFSRHIKSAFTRVRRFLNDMFDQH